MEWVIIPTVGPRIQYFPNYIPIKKNHDPWDIVLAFYEHYDLDKFKVELRDMYWAAAHDPISFDKKKYRHRLDFLYERISDLATVGYLLADNRCKEFPEKSSRGVFPPDSAPQIHFHKFYLLDNIKPTIWDRVFAFYTYYDLDFFEAELWEMYRSSAQDKVIYRNRSERYDLIFLYERISDLATAMYEIARQQWLRMTNYSPKRKQPKVLTDIQK